mgnify:CR=1 FL=1
MQKTENIYMQDNNRRMPEITDDLYFVIDEKMNSVELTDKGHEALSKYFNEEGFFVLPDIGARIAEIEKDYSGGKGPEARCRNQRLRRQSRARTYGHPIAEGIRDVRERCRIRGNGQQGEDRR